MPDLTVIEDHNVYRTTKPQDRYQDVVVYYHNDLSTSLRLFGQQ